MIYTSVCQVSPHLDITYQLTPPLGNNMITRERFRNTLPLRRCYVFYKLSQKMSRDLTLLDCF